MINNNTKDLLQRKQVGKIIIDSKKDNYIITTVYISPYTLNIKKDENIFFLILINAQTTNKKSNNNYQR